MKNYQLLEGISYIEEDLLEECETVKHTHRPIVFKALVAAAVVALLSVTAFATGRWFANVQKGEVVPYTFHMECLDAQWNVTHDAESDGYILTAEIDTYKNVPMKLAKPYLPEIPENWKCAGAATAKYNDEIGMVSVSWTYEENGQEYAVTYRQESAGVYNAKEDGEVWWITDAPKDVTMTGTTTTIGDASVYQVEVSESKHSWSHPSYAHRLIFWSDGYSIFMLQLPQYWQKTQIYELMCSLELQTDIEAAISNLQ